MTGSIKQPPLSDSGADYWSPYFGETVAVYFICRIEYRPSCLRDIGNIEAFWGTAFGAVGKIMKRSFNMCREMSKALIILFQCAADERFHMVSQVFVFVMREYKFPGQADAVEPFHAEFTGLCFPGDGSL